MRRLTALFIAFLSTSSLAHDIQLVTQHTKINRQHVSAWQTDVLGKAVVTSKWDFGLQATYLERFNLFENRAGAFVVFHPLKNLTLEARYLKGESGVEILPQDQYNFSLYHALSAGISPYVLYQNSLYSITHLQLLRLGVEIEKIKHLIIIPQLMLGQAQFKTPGQTREVNNYGLKMIYYHEQHYSFSLYGYKGIEAAQGIVPRSSQTVSTQTVGVGGSYHFIPNVKTELLFDYNDLGELNNQFLTTTLNMLWMF